ncbi:lytic transglycosylase domain-containing protein [Aestuariivirga sp.]|uniref:lytic murein transglycosylase n=1 Tax=Aestuariivirga sp. TaxID=2650926 RepID=UPI003919E0B1
MRRSLLCLTFMLAMAGSAAAASCGDTGSGFEKWKAAYAAEAKAQGVGRKGLAALERTSYSRPTIRADRAQHSFKLGLGAFMEKRGAVTIVARGRKLKAQNAKLFAQIEKRYGVPAGPLIAIWGMETAFGAYMGKQNTLSAVATLAYDCRRPEYFREQLIAALQLVDEGVLSSSSVGAMHGEVGQTQFLPKNVLLYGVDGDGGGINLNKKADALASTANFLRGHGWQRGAGYQPGEPNFAALQGWNAASVYQQALAIMGREIDEE